MVSFCKVFITREIIQIQNKFGQFTMNGLNWPSFCFGDSVLCCNFFFLMRLAEIAGVQYSCALQLKMVLLPGSPGKPFFILKLFVVNSVISLNTPMKTLSIKMLDTFFFFFSVKVGSKCWTMARVDRCDRERERD